MSVITRRDAFRATGLALATPFALAKVPTLAYGQTSSPSVSSPVFNKDLARYAISGICSAIKASKDGSLSPSHLQRAASCSHLYARHLESIGIDEPFTESLNKINFDSYLSNANTIHAQMLASAQSSDSSITSSDMVPVTLSKDEFETAKAWIIPVGLSHVHHCAGDAFQAAASQLPGAAGYQPTVWENDDPPRLIRSLEYKPHVVEVMSSTCKTKLKKYSCAALSKAQTTLSLSSGTAVICCAIVWADTGNLEGIPLCNPIVAGTMAVSSTLIGKLQSDIGC